MSYYSNPAYPPFTLANNHDGSTFAARARAAELNAHRSRIADREAEEREAEAEAQAQTKENGTFASVSLGSYVVFKPSHRGRSSKTLNSPKAPDENTQPHQHHTQAGQRPAHPSQQHSASGLSHLDKTGTSSTPVRTPRSRPHPLEPFPPLLESFTFSPPRFTTSPTHLSASENSRDTWASEDSSDFNVMPPSKMKGFSPGTPSSDVRNALQQLHLPPQSSRQNSGQFSDNTKKADPLLDHRAEIQPSHIASFHPTQSPYHSDMTTPQQSRSAKPGITPQSKHSSASHRSAKTPAMDDPFSDRSRATSSNYLVSSGQYDPQNNYAQQTGYGQQQGSTQHAEYYQQSPYHQQTAYDQSAYGQTAYAHQPSYGSQQFTFNHQQQYSQQPGYGGQQSSYVQQSPYTQQSSHGGQQASYSQQPQISQQSATNPRAGARMPPPAVKGTPTYDARLGVLQSQLGEHAMQEYVNMDPQEQEQVLDAYCPVEAASEARYARDPHKKLPQSHEVPSVSRLGGDKTAKQPQIATPHMRDPAPYTGFGGGSGSKKEMLLQNLNEVVESSKAQGELFSSTRTVLHDPVAQKHSNKPSSTTTGSTLKPQAPSFQYHNTQRKTAAESLLSKDLLDSSDPLPSGSGPSGHGAEDFFTGPYPGSAQASIAASVAQHRQVSNLGLARRATSTSDGRQDPKLVQGGSAESTPHRREATMSVKDAIAETFIPRRDPNESFPGGFSKQPMKYTVTGHPIPHGGFADFSTPYNIHLFDAPKGTFGDFDSQAAGNVFMKSLVQDQQPKKSEDALQEGVKWFRSNARDRVLEDVAEDLVERAAALTRRDFNTNESEKKTLPKPIGHERAAKLSSPVPCPAARLTSDLMINPTPQDGADLMAGVFSNLMGYADSTQIGGHFANYVRPGEWAIDKSENGNKSFFGEDWGAPPARVGRDPRYQRTLHDGRETYFEDPGRAQKKQWGIP